MNVLLGLAVKGVSTFFERRGRIKARQLTVGWMDDYLLALHSIPMIMVFIPMTRETGIEGINALALLPDWYLSVWFSMVGAVWGLPKLAGLRLKK